MTKLLRNDTEKATDLEKQISVAMTELETASDVEKQIKELFFHSAKELEFGNKKSVIIFVPFPQLRDFQKVQISLIRELEKKFSGRHFVIIARRRFLPKPKRGKNRKPEKQKRPRSRTLTSVHDAVLGDLVYPAEVVGRRTRVKLDGRRIMKVHLDKANQTNVEHKVDTFSAIYKHLTGRDVVFEFPEPLF